VCSDLDVFLDIASIRSSEDWAKRLEDEIARRDAFYMMVQFAIPARNNDWVIYRNTQRRPKGTCVLIDIGE
jgi:hypothetical protein